MITKTISITTKEIHAEHIWKLMTDVNNWKNWDPSVEDARLHGEFTAGNFFTLKPKGGPTVNVHLLEVHPTSYFKDVTNFPLAKMYDEHWYEDTPEGLKITSTLTMRGPLSFLWYQIVMKDIVKHLSDDIRLQINEAKKV